MLRSRITRLEDRLDLVPTNEPAEPTEEHLITPTPPQEPQRQLKFWLPPPRLDPNKIMKEYDIPESTVNILMVGAKEQDSTMNYLRDICYPAKIWTPYREIRDKSPFRKLLLMG